MTGRGRLDERLAGLSPRSRGLLEERLRLAESAHPTPRIRPRAHDMVAPLSFAQSRLWFLDRLRPGSPAYNESMAFRVRGPLSIEVLEASLDEIVRRHEVLRTSFPVVDGKPIQRVSRSAKIEMRVCDLAGIPSQSRDEEARRLVRAHALRLFDLGCGPLIRSALIRLRDEDHVLVVTNHHIVSDEWSRLILAREVFALYEAFLERRPSPLSDLDVQYADFSIWQGSEMDAGRFDSQLEYWRKHLEEAPPLTQLPADFSRPDLQSLKGGVHPIRIDRTLTESLEALGRQHGCTLFIVLLAALKAFLSRHTGSDDIVVAVPIANRTHREMEGLIGLFVNTLVLRTDLTGDPTFSELLDRVRTTAAHGYANQDYPFEKLVEELRPDRNLGHAPLAQVMLSLHAIPQGGASLPLADLEPLPIEHGMSRLDLTFELLRTESGLEGSLEYNADIFSAETIALMSQRFTKLLRVAVEEPGARISELDILSAWERQRMIEHWNRTDVALPSELCIHTLFERQADRTPDAVAVLFDGEEILYRELEDRANRIARALITRGVRPEHRIAVCLERTPGLLAAVLGVLKAGAAYVPLDPVYPRERLRYMLQDCGAAALIVERQHEGLFEHPAAEVLLLEVLEESEGDGSHGPRPDVKSEGLAYVLYTSGSTGTPKGVAIEHRSAVNLLRWAAREFDVAETESVLAASSICFDLSVFEIFLPLSRGGRVVLVPNVLALRDSVDAGAVTMITTVPSAMVALAQFPLPESVRVVTMAGETLPRELVTRLHERSGVERIINLYGPSETTTYSTGSVTDPAGTGAPDIGRPISNTRIYVVDSRMRLVPTGVIGEIVIGGAGVARGYWERPDLTAERFVPDPFSGLEGGRLYRTGDLGRQRSDGSLEFCGRRDYQVKVRGYRIELGEVDAALMRHPLVREAVTLQDDAGRLAAYVVLREPMEEFPAPLKDHLRSFLIEPMVPSVIAELDAMPLTASGKVDRGALPDSASDQRGDSTVYVAPRSREEDLLARIWSEVLGLESIGVHDSFFELGGHSLLATQVAFEISQSFRVDVPIVALFQADTVAKLARVVAEAMDHQEDFEDPTEWLSRIEPDRSARHDPFPLTDVQQAYWVGRSTAFTPDGVSAHGYTEIIVDDITRFQLALQRLIERHDMLRAVVGSDGLQRVLPGVDPYQIPIRDLRRSSPASAESEIADLRQRMSHQVLPADQWPVFEFQAIRVEDRRYRIHISVDGLFSDAGSYQILLDEFVQLYEDPTASLPPLDITFRDCVVAEEALHRSPLWTRSRDYWLERLDALPAAPDLPKTGNEPPSEARFTRRDGRLDAASWRSLKDRATRNGMTPAGVLLAAFSEILACWSRTDRFIVNLTFFNRLPIHPQVNQVVGDFTSTLLLEVDRGGICFRERGRHLQERLWRDLDHRHFSGVQVLRELARRRGSLTQAAMPIVFTSTLNLPTPSRELVDVSQLGEVVYSVTQTPQVWLDHQVFDEPGGGLLYNWDAVDEVFPPGMVDDMFMAYAGLLERLATDEAPWEEDDLELVPRAQLEQRRRINSTGAAIPNATLPQLILARVDEGPERPAVVTEDQILSYGELWSRSAAIAEPLREAGSRPDSLVGIFMDKGWEQVVAVLSVLQAGAAYLPISPELPDERVRYLLRHGEVRAVLSQSWQDAGRDCLSDVQRIDVDTLAAQNVSEIGLLQKPDDLAYVLYTSGTTGLPKGVMVSNRSVVNRVVDINRRFGVGREDRAIALTSLHHDLSVYDLFGLLMAGGSIAVPTGRSAVEPADWVEFLRCSRVTLWNSVPTFMVLLLDYVEQFLEHEREPWAGLRLALLSGDWIPLDLPNRLWAASPATKIVALGGPTETTVWDIGYPVETIDPRWASIPYGAPLANARYHVLDERLSPRPTWVPGPLYIAGAGLARGYWRDEQLSRDRFIRHPATRERLYRSGDIGRYLPDGNIELLGREDFQVKIRGHRVELREIDSVLTSHSSVQTAVAVAAGERGSLEIVAYVVPTAGSSLLERDLLDFLQLRLPRHAVPRRCEFLDALPLTPNGKIDRLALTRRARQPAAIVSRAVEAPSAVTGTILEQVRSVMADVPITVDSNLLQLGANSIDMVRISNLLQSALGFRPNIDEFYEEPTVAGLARAFDRAAPDPHADSRIPGGTRDGPRIDVPLATEMIVDPEERQRFIERRSGLREAPPGVGSLILPAGAPAALAGIGDRRRSHRRFALQPIPLEEFGAVLAVLRQNDVEDTASSRCGYGSAGSTYGVQAYVHVKAGRVEGVAQGTYYYHPVAGRLDLLSPDAEVDARIHVPFINRPVYAEAAFSLYLIAELKAIAPLYGEDSLRFATIEAGLMTQLLEMAAAEVGLGLCQIGSIDFPSIRGLFRLDASHRLLHSLVGGKPDESEVVGQNAETGLQGAAESRAVRLMNQVAGLSDEAVRKLLNAHRRGEDRG